MECFEEFDWGRAGPRDAAAMVATASIAQIDRLARGYDWTAQPIPVMAAILRRPDCPLATALTIFLNCSPGAARDRDRVGAECDHLKLAEIVEKAINAGRFAHDPAFGLDDHARSLIAIYVKPPTDRQGPEWALDPAIVAPLLAERTAAPKRRGTAGGGLLRSLTGLLRPRPSA